MKNLITSSRQRLPRKLGGKVCGIPAVSHISVEFLTDYQIANGQRRHHRHGIPIIIVIVEKLVTIVLKIKFEDYLSGDLVKPIHHILSLIINEKVRYLSCDYDLTRKIK